MNQRDNCVKCGNHYDICKCPPFDDEMDAYTKALESTEPLVEEEIKSEPWEETDEVRKEVVKGNNQRLQEAINRLDETSLAKKVASGELHKAEPEPDYQAGFSDGYDAGYQQYAIDKQYNIDKQYDTVRERNKFEVLGTECGKLVEQKQAAYGDSFGRSGNCLREMFPNGITPEQYDDLLTIARMLDKLFRIANNPDAFDENPYRDCVGYSLLGMERYERKRESNE